MEFTCYKLILGHGFEITLILDTLPFEENVQFMHRNIEPIANYLLEVIEIIKTIIFYTFFLVGFFMDHLILLDVIWFLRIVIFIIVDLLIP